MSTIKKILKENWCSIWQYKECIKSWICNWIWGKGWINFDKIMYWLPYFDTTRWKQLHKDLDYLSMCHDKSYNKWWNILDFIKSNYILSVNILRLIHWTKWYSKLLVFILVFGGTTMFGFRYFNWK